MAWLKVYEWEREKYPEYRSIDLTTREIEMYFNKLCRHFKLPAIPIKRCRRNGSYFRVINHYPNKFYDTASVHFGLNPDLGTVVHEFAHYLNYKRNEKNGHGKEFKRELKRSYTFAKRWLKKL